MHYDNEKEVFKQVRAKQGGGTRKLSVSKDANKKQLIQEAVHLFFPNGRNSLGSLTDFELGLTNYQEVPLDEVTTVGKLYQETKLPLLRFYLTTQTKERNDRPPSQIQLHLWKDRRELSPLLHWLVLQHPNHQIHLKQSALRCYLLEVM